MRRCLPAFIGAAVLACAGPAHAQSTAPLVTVGVDVLSATATQVTYVLYVANRGTAPAPNTVVTNTVPENTSYASSDRVPQAQAEAPCVSGLPAGGTCRWALGDLPPGASATVAVTYSLDQTTSTYTVSNAAAAQIHGAAPAADDAQDSDMSLVRQVHLLDIDAHIDATQPSKNFGACAQLDVRRDGSRVAFADNDTVGDNPFVTTSRLSTAERVWSARVGATIASITPGATMTLSLHRVESDNWSEGSGPCAGEDGSGRVARGAARPESSSTPAATALAAGAGVLAWDVTDTLDTREEVIDFQGFEFRAGGAGAGADTVSLHSSEAEAAADGPRLVSVRTDHEDGRCIDSDAETAAGPSDQPHRLDAYVTEVTGGSQARVEGPGGDGCPGFPHPATGVAWELDDDAPDSYISSLAGTPPTRGVDGAGGAGPNSGSTLTDGGGRSFIEVRRGDPWGPLGDDPQIRIAAIAIGQRDGVDVPGPYGSPEPEGCTGVIQACPTGEVATEDDARRTWLAPLGPKPIAPAPSPSGGAEPASAAPSTPVAARSVALRAPTGQGLVGREVRLSGRLESSAPACAGPNEYVQILRRRRGSSEFSDFASASTEAGGAFEVPVVLDASGDYMAVAPERPGCAGASSSATGVLARGLVQARVAVAGARRGRRVTVRGRVIPALAGRVVLERRVGRRWTTVARRRVSRRGTFSFPLRTAWSRRRSFRVRWVSPHPYYVGGVSRTLSVRSRRSR